MMIDNSEERIAAEKIMGTKFENMTQEQRVLAAECLAAFENVWRKNDENVLA